MLVHRRWMVHYERIKPFQNHTRSPVHFYDNSILRFVSPRRWVYHSVSIYRNSTLSLSASVLKARMANSGLGLAGWVWELLNCPAPLITHRVEGYAIHLNTSNLPEVYDHCFRLKLSHIKFQGWWRLYQVGTGGVNVGEQVLNFQRNHLSSTWLALKLAHIARVYIKAYHLVTEDAKRVPLNHLAAEAYQLRPHRDGVGGSLRCWSGKAAPKIR